MSRRKQYAFNSEIELNFIPVHFIEEEMFYLRRDRINEENTERQEKLEFAYRVLEKLVEKWRQEDE